MGDGAVDVNGDGLPDILYGYTDGFGVPHYSAYINTGSAWVASSTWNPPTTFSKAGSDTSARIVDVNGDGLPDILIGSYNGVASTFYAYIDNGHGWAENNSLNPPLEFK